MVVDYHKTVWNNSYAEHEVTGKTIKGNLAHKCMELYFLCLSFHLDVYNMMKAKNIGNPG